MGGAHAVQHAAAMPPSRAREPNAGQARGQHAPALACAGRPGSPRPGRPSARPRVRRLVHARSRPGPASRARSAVHSAASSRRPGRAGAGRGLSDAAAGAPRAVSTTSALPSYPSTSLGGFPARLASDAAARGCVNAVVGWLPLRRGAAGGAGRRARSGGVPRPRATRLSPSMSGSRCQRYITIEFVIPFDPVAQAKSGIMQGGFKTCLMGLRRAGGRAQARCPEQEVWAAARACTHCLAQAYCPACPLRVAPPHLAPAATGLVA